MIHYKESEYTGKLKHEVDSLLGEKPSFILQFKHGIVGSSLYRVIFTKINGQSTEWKDLNVRANFEKYPQGLLLRINHNQELSFIAISHKEIESIELEEGKETIRPFPFGLMYWLLKFGIHIRYARYFVLRGSYYSITRMKLFIKGNNEAIILDSNGYNYYNELKYFENFKK